MTTQELRQSIEKVLGNSIRCLLPSYWWKRLFNQVADRIDDKQDTLVSGKNIKTINGKDLLGEGDTNADIIINSVDELNALDLPTGSRASVVTGGPVLSSIRDCVESNDKTQWTRVSGVQINAFPDFSLFPADVNEASIYFFEGTSPSIYIIARKDELGLVMGAVRLDTSEIIYLSVNGGGISQNAVDRLNGWLKTGDYKVAVYDGLNDISDFFDSFIKFYIYHPTISEVYIKADSWEKLSKECVVSSEEELNALSVENGTIAKVVSGSRIVGSFNSLAVGDRVYDVEFMQPPYASGGCSVMFKDKDGNDIGFGVDSNGTECQFGLTTSDVGTIIFGNEKGINQELYNQAITIFKEKECTFELVEGKLPVDSFVRPVTNTPVVSNAYIKGETWTRLLKEGDVTGGDSKSVLFYMPLNDGLSDIQKQTNAESYKKIVDGFKNNVYYNVKVFGLYTVIDATVVGNALLTEGRIALMFDMLNTWQVMEVLEDGSATVEEVDAWKGCEIREFYIGDSLTDQQKAWNLETAMMVEEKKCTTVFKVTASMGILPAGTTIPLSAFVDRTFLYVFSSGVNAAFVSVTIDSDGNSDITAESVSTDNALSSTSTNAVQNKVVTNALKNKADKSQIPTKLSQLEKDIEIGSSIAVDSELSKTSTNPVQNKVVKEYVDSKIGDINTLLDKINEEVI